jgi:hypothetical protein
VTGEPKLPEDVAKEAELRGHRPTHEGRVRSPGGSTFDRWSCGVDDCLTELRRWSTGSYDGSMLARSCGPFQPVRRSSR